MVLAMTLWLVLWPADVGKAAVDLYEIVTRSLQTTEDVEKQRADIRSWIDKWGEEEGDEDTKKV